MNNELKDFWQSTMNELTRSNTDRKHPFVLATLASKGSYPGVRIVVKRGMDEERHFWFYADSRSEKVAEIKNDHAGALLFYHDKKKLQIRVNGHYNLHREGAAYEKHRSIALQRPGDYQKPSPPGTSIHHPSDGKGGGDPHFLLIEFIPVEWDVLQLGDTYHSRGIFQEKKGAITGHWIVP